MELSRLFIVIHDGLPSEEKAALTEEIYQIIDEEVIEDRGAVEDITDLSASREKNTGGLNSSSNNNFESNNGSSLRGDKSNENSSTPGFGLLSGLTCLYGGWKLGKK